MSVIIAGRSGAARLFEEGVFRCDSLIAAGGLRLLRSPESVLIVGEDAELPRFLEVFAATADADGSFDAKPLRGTAVLTCGISGRNTISVTSRTSDSITLSLNRSVMTLRGICEPFEFPLTYPHGASDYDIMSAFAAAVALGNFS